VNRSIIIAEIVDILAKSGFYISDPRELRSISFDIICRRDDSLLIFKVLSNVDSLTKDTARQLAVLASFLGASPVVVGQRSLSGKLEDGIIYLRHQISIITVGTLYDILIEGVYPSVFAAPGGFYVNLDGDLMHRIRKERGTSLGDIARSAGVSRKAIQMYEDGMSAMLDVGLTIEETLGVTLITPLNPLSYNRDLERERENIERLDEAHSSLRSKLNLLGYEVIPLFRCPFDAFTRDDRVLFLTGFQSHKGTLREKAKVMSSLSSITEHHSVVFLREHTDKKNIAGTPIIMEDELAGLAYSAEILELVNERKGKVRKC